MRLNGLVVFFVFLPALGLAQGKKSKGDAYFFQYAYQQAIEAYENTLGKSPLTLQQQLNLADAYFHTKDFENASKVYVAVYKKDNLMGNHHFNKMLQSLSKSSGQERINAFLAIRTTDLEKELLENAAFNFEVLQSNKNDELDFEIFNLDSNSAQSDFSPAFYEEKLLFSSGRPKGNKKRNAALGEAYLDIYVGRISENGQLLNPNPFVGIPASNFHKATPNYSEKLQGVFYVLSNTDNGELAFDANGKNALAIAMQVKEGPFRLLLRDLSTSFYYPFYDENSGKLYFAANLENGYGGTDLYFMYTNNGQIMSAPINLGPRINSPGNEIAPFVFENSLYFSSDVYYGLGGMDVYKSNLERDEGYSIPVNLGSGINSPDDDFGFVMRSDGDGLLGYFSSNRPGGKGEDDIYGFKVDQKPGIKTLTLKGVVAKPYSASEVIPKVVVQVLDSNGKLLKETYSDENGTYRLEIPWQESVMVKASKGRYSQYQYEFKISASEQITTHNLNIGLSLYDDLVEEKEGQKVIKLQKFYFGRGKTTITPEVAKELDKVVDFVQQFPESQLRIETYTDSRGGSSTNFRLTQSRSDAIKTYLLQQGVPASTILYTMGYGEDKILNNCKNGVFCLEMLHQQNQRSLIVILNDNILFE
ncbi:MAG: OmpA family protein [Bacteroidota bacterium]